MEQYKILQPYKDWMLLTRGKIEPRVGDKVKEFILPKNYELSGFIYLTQIYLDIYKDYLNEDKGDIWLSRYLVEVPYPVIEWINDSKELVFEGYIGRNFHLFTIKKDINSFYLVEDDFHESLIDCKIRANKLLYGITE